MWVDEERLASMLMDRESPGVFTRALGFGTGTYVMKGVHVMNDLAQSVLGGCPTHNGDLLAAVIREDKVEKEDNSDEALRASPRLGMAYGSAFPDDDELPAHHRTAVRAAIADIVNFDGGVYRPGDRMASGLVTHRDLLGAEGFTRFGVGRYLFRILGSEGQARLRALYESANDPYARALAPLLWATPLRQADREWPDVEPTDLDRALGEGLTNLLSHPIAKPHLLRLFLHAASLGLLLKVFGLGSAGGCPTLLATSAEDDSQPRLLREEAVQSLQRGLVSLDVRLAQVLAADPGLTEVLNKKKPKGPAQETSGDPAELLAMARGGRISEGKIYWPDRFVIALGRRAGCVLPKDDRAGWGKRLVLTSDLVEALVLMFVPPGARPRPWQALWGEISARLGVVIGADSYDDARALTAVGVVQVRPDLLEKNQGLILSLAVRRGVARHLPDDGAEAGGALQ